MTQEGMGMQGWLDWKLYDENGNLKEYGSDHNQIQNQFKRNLAARLIKAGASTASFFTYMALSTGAVGNVSATSMTSWCPGVATTISSDGTTLDNVATFTATIPAGRQTGTIASAGFLSATTATGLKCWATCALTKAAGDSLALTWTITYSG